MTLGAACLFPLNPKGNHQMDSLPDEVRKDKRNYRHWAEVVIYDMRGMVDFGEPAYLLYEARLGPVETLRTPTECVRYLRACGFSWDKQRAVWRR
jgi:hypothetical protein